MVDCEPKAGNLHDLGSWLGKGLGSRPRVLPLSNPQSLLEGHTLWGVHSLAENNPFQAAPFSLTYSSPQPGKSWGSRSAALGPPPQICRVPFPLSNHERLAMLPLQTPAWLVATLCFDPVPPYLSLANGVQVRGPPPHLGWSLGTGLRLGLGDPSPATDLWLNILYIWELLSVPPEGVLVLGVAPEGKVGLRDQMRALTGPWGDRLPS